MDISGAFNYATGSFNGTTAAPGSPDLPQYVGFIGCTLASIFFGSNFIPVKKFETGDGVFFQLILCLGIWVPSVILHAIRGFPRFWPLAMLGGFIWATGNMMVVPIIQSVGMAMGILIWSSVNMLVGWASGRFGWFGLDPEIPDNTTMNYFGVATCFCSAIVVSLIKPHIENPGSSRQDVAVNETEPLITPFAGDPHTINSTPPAYGSVVKTDEQPSVESDSSTSDGPADQNSMVGRLSPRMRKIVGVILCILSGMCYGVNFAPVIYIKDNYHKWYPVCHEDPCVEGVSSKDIDYVFSHFTGILLSGILYFVIYGLIKKNQPVVYPKVMLPALLSGVLWSIADIGFFLANEVLDESVSFPIINAGPGVIASLWGVFLFKEIRGRRNILLLCFAFALTSGGCVLCGLSK